MPKLRTSLVAGALVGALLTPASAAQAAPISLAAEQTPTPVAAWNGVVMWSRFDPAAQTYALMKSIDGGAPQAVGVMPRRGGPFDIDLGTSRSGSTYGVYTRDGDIYRLSVATGAELKIDKLSSPLLAERDPTIQRGQIAFIRRDRGYDQLRIGGTTSAAKGTRMLVKNRSIVSAELGAKQIAYIVTGPGPISDSGTRYVRVRNIRTGADRQVYRATSGGANFANVTRPAYVAAPEGFVWARTNLGSGKGNRIVRYTLRGSRLTYALGSPYYTSIAWAGGALGAATASSLAGGDSLGACGENGRNHCQIAATGLLQFNREP